MRLAGRLKLGFYPLPCNEAERIRVHCNIQTSLPRSIPALEMEYRFLDWLEQRKRMHTGSRSTRCPAESVSLLYLNPPYDFEVGQQGNKRLELVFLEHTSRWLKPKGVLVFVIPRSQLKVCARLLAEQFSGFRLYRLTELACIKYDQVVVLAFRRGRNAHPGDAELVQTSGYLAGAATDTDIPALTDTADAVFPVPSSPPVTLTYRGIPLDQVEDLILHSSAYRQASRVLIREPNNITGRPLTPLHGGHVSLLATAGMLNGVVGQGEDRHIAHWRSVKFVDHWEENEPNGVIVKHDRERFSHELTLVFADGRTQILSHEKDGSDSFF